MWIVLYSCPISFWFGLPLTYTGCPKKRNSRYSRFFRTLLWDQQLSFFNLVLDRASFPHYNNTKIIKFGWEYIILWVISYGLSFSGFARIPEFRGTINDSFSSTCANTYQHSTSYKEISVTMTCLDCKSLLGNTRITEHNTRSIYGWPKLKINRASELWKSGNSRKWQSIRITHKIKSSQPNLMILVLL